MSFWIVGQVVPSLALSNISFVSETDTSSHLTIHNYGKGWSINPLTISLKNMFLTETLVLQPSNLL